MSDAIRAEHLGKFFRRVSPGERLRTLKSALLERRRARPREGEAIAALEDVSFSVAKGEAFGVIGGNGSGKSTLLKVVAGILSPTSGSLEVAGRVAALIELGAGFHPEISGRENVFINGAILGLSRKEIAERYERIVEFSGLADFMEEPVKNYSSGMYVRLGFAVAIHTDPDILLVDEVLAVGDEAFAHRCLARIEEFLAAGRTLLLVSHSLALVEQYCDRVLWLDRGRARLIGPPRRVTDAYRQAVAEAEGEAHRQQQEEPLAEATRWGSQVAEIEAVRLQVGGEERYYLASGEPVTFELEVRAHEALADFVFGIALHTPRGVECWGTNTDLAGFVPERLEGSARIRLSCPSLRLAPGEYLVDAAVHSREGAPYDYRKGVIRFSVTAQDRGVGLYFPEHAWGADGGVRWRKPSA
ncbi:MAG TPA: ABC transporter ATP-binding protein [Thermoanaerobaculia bacterium]|nr:ABC transporter ATP-binding protein [Thermoanaerobaculia bacterium]